MLFHFFYQLFSFSQVGIDYTASNKQPTDPSSLHFIDPEKPNEYMQAIRLVGDILAPYDNDGKIPTYGFGGFINQTKQNLDFFQSTELIKIQSVLAFMAFCNPT